MRIVKIASYYNAALKYYYTRFPGVKKLSYQEQLSHLLSFGLGWADFYSRALRQLGWEAHEIIANASSLQASWAKENNFQGNNTEIVMEQIRRLKPDVVWFQDSINFHPDFFEQVRSLPDVKVIIGNSCAPYSQDNLRGFRKFDFITTCSPKFVNEFSALGLKTLLLYQAFDPDILTRIITGEKKFDLIFIGSLIIGREFHNQRIDFLRQLLSTGLNIRIHANVEGSRPQDIIKKQVLYLTREVIKTLGLRSLVKNSLWYRKSLALNEFPHIKFLGQRLRRQIKPPVFGMDMFQILAQAKICINYHVQAAGEYAANMRMFETTGVGTILLTDNKKNINELFIPDQEIVVYNDFNEAAEKIRYLLDNPDKARQIAQAGQRRTLRDHTYLNRAKQLIKEIQKYL